MNSIKIIIIVVISLANVGLSSCGEVRTRDGIFTQDDTAIADNRCEEIVNSLYNKDSEALKNMFSPNALKGATDIDDEIKYLMEFYQGKKISKDGAVIASSSKNHAVITSELECNYEVETDSDSYVIYFIDVLTDTGNPDNVGLYMLEIKKVQNKDDEMLEWGGEEKCPGIYIPTDVSDLQNVS